MLISIYHTRKPLYVYMKSDETFRQLLLQKFIRWQITLKIKLINNIILWPMYDLRFSESKFGIVRFSIKKKRRI